MILSCGESREVLENWHPFFAIFPRRVGTENGRIICAWLETIERKGKCHERFGWDWEYRRKP